MKLSTYKIPVLYRSYCSGIKIAFEKCKFEKMGGTALYLFKDVVNSTIRGTKFHDVADSAIAIGHVGHFTIGVGEGVCANNLITDNYIVNAGLDYYGACGITAYYVQDLKVLHNELEGLPYSGISVGWGWGASGSNTLRRIEISYNKIHNFMRNCKDGGGVYTLSPQPDSIIKENYVYNMVRDKGGAIYNDEGSAWITNYRKIIGSDVVNWIYIWTSSIHDIIVQENYTKQSALVNNGTNISMIGNVNVGTNDPWPSMAQQIIDNSGVTSEYSDVFTQ